MIDLTKSYTADTLFVAFNQMLEDEVFSILDIEVALSATVGTESELTQTDANCVHLAVALCHTRMRMGHTCIDLTECPKECSEINLSWPEASYWTSLFKRLSHANKQLPIKWEAPCRLYIKKLYHFEKELTEQIVVRSKNRKSKTNIDTQVNPALLEGCSNEQMDAVHAVLKSSMILLSGGPGTGKTFTVLRCIASILQNRTDSNIALCAPTGKAVGRLGQSIKDGLVQLPISEETKAKVPTEAQTIHRLIRSIENKPSGRMVPFPTRTLDWIFIDEVSMVDLPLMRRLLNAIPPTCHVFMLGDIHQLSSVQPGSVFADIYRGVSNLESITPNIRTIELKQTFRFRSDSKLFELCEAVKDGLDEITLSLLDHPAPNDEISWSLSDSNETNMLVESWIEEIFFDRLVQPSPEKALEALELLLILSATNHGPRGVKALNEKIEQRIRSHCAQIGESTYWAPIIIEQNDYPLGLFNGDVGVIAKSVGHSNSTPICHFRKTNDIISYNPMQLSRYSTAFCLSIHKSQGSEAESVLVFMPELKSPLLNRELFYTAISRAKQRLHVVGESEAIQRAIQTPTSRYSLLHKKIQREFNA